MPDESTMRGHIEDLQMFYGLAQELLPDIMSNVGNPIIVTDPPFNIGYKYATYHDSMGEQEYFALLQNVCVGVPHVVIHYPESLYQYAIVTKQAPTKVVSWVYNANTHRQHRDIAYFGIKPDFAAVGQEYKNPTDKRIAQRIAEGKRARLYDWWNVNQVKNVNKDKTAHPCQMPIEVMTNIIGTLPADATIIDPFAGSGTTGLACLMMGRKFVGIEMDARYYRVSCQRLGIAEARND